MNINKSTVYTPQLVAGENIKFIIPLYQRLFEWGEVQVEQLMRDLKEQFDNNKGGNYYIGMLTRVQHPNSDRWDLVDGQQRSVVMTLIGLVLQCYYCEWGKFIDCGERIAFVARQDDEDYIKRCNNCILQNGLDVVRLKVMIEGLANPNIKMRNALICICNFMSNITEGDEFAKFVYERMAFFFVELPKSYIENPTSLNKYFEVMNSSGKNLEQHEILKVKLLKGVAEKDFLLQIWNIVSQMDKLIISEGNDGEQELCNKYKTAIELCRRNDYEGALKYCIDVEIQNNQSVQSIAEVKPERKDFRVMMYEREEVGLISFSEFLLMVLDIELGLKGSDSYYNVNKLIERFYPTQGGLIANLDIPKFYNKLLYYRLLLDYYVVRKAYNDHREGYYTLLFNDALKEEQNEGRECLRQYQSMLNVSSAFYNWLKPYLVAIAQIENNSCINSLWLYRVLRKIDYKCHSKMPRLSKMSYGLINRYWFWRLDFHLWEYRDKLFTKEQKRAVDNYVFRENRSIEHLHPQDESLQREDWDRVNVDAFGNLAMISQGFNSQQSNDPVNLKFARIEDQVKGSKLQSLKLYVMYLEARCSSNEWTERLAIKNGKIMYRFLRRGVKNRFRSKRRGVLNLLNEEFDKL